MSESKRVLILGAGISGLYVARELLQKGWQVTLIEASDRVGGRIHTQNGVFGQPLETGAEFIHGKSPLTKALMRRAGIRSAESEEKFYRSDRGRITPADEPIPGMDQFMQKAMQLKKDTTLDTFLSTHFSDQPDLIRTIRRMAEGFDAADASRISMFSLRAEWSGDSMESSAILPKGYGELVRFLSREAIQSGAQIFLKKRAKEIRWSPGHVTIQCEDRSEFTGDKVVLTLSVGSLLAGKDHPAHLSFEPDLPNHRLLARSFGFGSAIKVVCQFSARFWADDRLSGHAFQVPDLGFLITESEFPVFWTHPEFPVITAWAGGGQAARLDEHSDAELIRLAMQGLSESLRVSFDFLNGLLVRAQVFNWSRDAYALGAYSYTTPESRRAKKMYSKPVADTIYFAGEALGKSHGTVESALESARAVIKNIP